MARAILRLISEAGRPVETGVEIDFPISRQDIAEMTGTTIFTVSRLLSTWEARYHPWRAAAHRSRQA